MSFAYDLRIHNFANCQAFISGRGAEILAEFCKTASNPRRFITRKHVLEDAQDAVTMIVEVYTKLFAGDFSSDYDMAENAEAFNDVITLMNAAGFIDDTPNVESPSSSLED